MGVRSLKVGEEGKQTGDGPKTRWAQSNKQISNKQKRKKKKEEKDQKGGAGTRTQAPSLLTNAPYQLN